MSSLIIGFDQFLKNKSFERAESYFLKSIFINAYQDVAIAEQKVKHYLSNPESDSSRLILAQWGAWGLTNLLDEQKKRTQANATYKLQIDIANKSYQIRPKQKEGARYYVVEYGNLKY